MTAAFPAMPDNVVFCLLGGHRDSHHRLLDLNRVTANDARPSLRLPGMSQGL
jgi:hypothetical protein